MSYVFDIGDNTVWSPALRVGDLYVRMLNDISAVLEVPTGLTAISSDMYEIDLDTFEKLVHAMRGTYFSTNHDVLRGLLAGTLGPSIKILERGGRSVIPESPEEKSFVDWAQGLSMPQ
ncbi:DUF6086 family protein [Nocardia jiangxiensis]|uniref:DUF6086 family protein n=1 Tax=Nocardia jiangxiensis TaxID=282685 RepID=A0ABW6RS22_9NOCA